MRLTEENILRLEMVLLPLNLTKSKLAKDTGISPSTISAFLNKESNRGITSIDLEKIYKYLFKSLEANEKRLKELNFYQDVKAKLCDLKNHEATELFNAGIYAVDGYKNTITTKADEEFGRLIEASNNSIFIGVQGTNRSGKTSLIKRGISKVIQKEDTLITISFKELLIIDNENNRSDIEFIAAKLIKHIEDKITGKSIKPLDKYIKDCVINTCGLWFPEQLIKLLSSLESQTIYLVLDDVHASALSKESSIPNYFFLLLSFCYDGFRKNNSKTYKIIIDLNAGTISTKSGSGFERFIESTSTGAFTLEEVKYLLNCYEIEEDIANELHSYLYGHQYLTHLAIEELMKNREFNFKNVKYQFNEFKNTKVVKYLKSIQSEIDFILFNLGCYEQKNTILKAVIEGNSNRILSKYNIELPSVFIQVGLLNFDFNISSEFVEKMLKKLIAINEESNYA